MVVFRTRVAIERITAHGCQVVAKRSGGFRSLAETATAVTAPVALRRGFPTPAVLGDWQTLVGARLAAHSLPERLAYPPRRREGGTLYVRIDSPSLAVELQHLAPMVIERFNTHCGFAAVAQLKMRHGPLPKRHAKATDAASPARGNLSGSVLSVLAALENQPLQQALRDLGGALTPDQSDCSADGGDR